MFVQNTATERTRHLRRSIITSLVIALALMMGVVWGAPAAAEGPTAANMNLGVNAVTAGAVSVTLVARTGKWIEVVLSRQRLYARQNGRIVMSSAISSGISRYPTLRGTFHVYVKYWAIRMRGPGYNLPGVPYTMYYYRGYAIHGAYWHNNFGHPMSHGCINLPVAFARRLYMWAPVGITVVVH